MKVTFQAGINFGKYLRLGDLWCYYGRSVLATGHLKRVPFYQL